MMIARHCSASASASCAAAGVDDGEPRLPAVSLAHLLQGPDAAPPEYLTLSLTPAGEAWPRPEQPGEVTLNHINAPRDYLRLSVPPSDEDEPSTILGGSLVASVASSGAAETRLPPRKRKLGHYAYRETVGTAAPASSSRSLALAIVVYGDDNVPESSRTHDGDAEKRSPAAMATEPVDAIPLQMMYRGHAHAKEITMSDAASSSSAAAAPIDAVPLRAAPCPYVPHAAGAAPLEPAWIHTALGLQPGHALYFIAQKRVECSDLEAQQSRLRIPSAGVDRLLPLLSDEGRQAANLLDNLKPRERPQPQASGGNGRAQGRKHGGLVVPLYINRAGDRMDARLTRWDSNDYTVLKYGNGNSQSFVRGSGLKVMDRIQIWAFLNPGLHLVIHKIDGGETTAAPSASAGGQQSKPPSIV